MAASTLAHSNTSAGMLPGLCRQAPGGAKVRLRAKYLPDEKPSVRFVGSKAMHFPVLGDIRLHGCGRALAKMIATGRFHPYSASFSFKAGRWFVSVAGVAAPFHHQRRSKTGRHLVPVGADRGVKALIVAASADGAPYKSWVVVVAATWDCKPSATILVTWFMDKLSVPTTRSWYWPLPSGTSTPRSITVYPSVPRCPLSTHAL